MPILHANLETDFRLAAQLDQALRITLTDQAAIRRLPGAIDWEGNVNGSGSDTHRLRYVSLGGADAFQTTAAEDSDPAETPITTTSVDIAVVRSALLRNQGDLATVTGYAMDINPMTLAQDMMESYDSHFNQVFATALATATTNVGTSGVNMSNDDFHDAIYTLQLNSVPGPYFAGLHPQQHNDWQESLRGEGGSAQFAPATFEQLQISGQGLSGSYLGVSIFRMTDIVATATDREGGMWGVRAFGYKTAQVDQRSMLGTSAAVAVRMDEVTVEISRDSSRALVEIVGNAYFGISVKEQARLVGIVTDA